MACSERNGLIIAEPYCNFDHTYRHDLQMYIYPPLGQIILTELQELCIERLKVLQLVDRISSRNHKISLKQRKVILVKELVRNNLVDYAKLINAPGCKSHTDMDIRIRRKDHISHFLLRSAFAFQFEKKRWFYRQEVRLFKWRFSSLDTDGIKQFNYRNGFCYNPISQEEIQEVKDYLEISTMNINHIHNVSFYKVLFIDVLNLIGKRNIFVRDGMAFVPETNISSIFVTHFKKNLSAGFEYAREIAAKVSGDERLTSIFKYLSSSVKIRNSQFEILGRTYINELDKLSEKSYPLCMRMLHDVLRSNHHLTNGGRVQYGLFLKGIGVSLNDALQFWENEFTKKMDKATFQKNYKYHIRYLYGMEGKRANYEPFNCFKIKRSEVGLRDNHGCPFKHMVPNVLSQKLRGYNLTDTDIKAIVKLSQAGQHLEACRKYYESTHGCTRHKLFKHPNEYFNESRKIHIDQQGWDDTINLSGDIT